MQLIYIELSNYKSIKKPVKIDIADSNFYTFIGKNGSGKSNILKALELAVSRYKFDNSADRRKADEKWEAEEKGFKAVYTLELSDEEYKEYLELTQDKRLPLQQIRFELVDGEPDLKWRSYPVDKLSVKKYNECLQEIIPLLDNATKEFRSVFKKFEKSVYGHEAFTRLKMSFDEKTGYYPDFNYCFWDEIHQIEDLSATMKNFLSQSEQEEFTIGEDDLPYFYRGFKDDIDGIKILEVQTEDVAVSGIVAQNLKKNAEQYEKIRYALSQSVQSYNVKFKTLCEKINSLLLKVASIRKEAKDIFYKKTKQQQDKWRKFEDRKDAFKELINTILFPELQFIDNENSLLFYSAKDDDRARKLNAYNTIVKSMDAFLKKGGHYEEGESLFDDKTFTEERQQQIVKILNDKCLQKGKPKFDKEIKYKLEIENGRIQLYVIEKDKTVVNFNDTSLGRRWYLTFLFVKRLLKDGDYLIVDEPAVFLHPQAQTEFRKELERLSFKGVKIFMSTHSPYMISDDWKSVYTVTMGVGGTATEKIYTPDDLKNKIQSELGGELAETEQEETEQLSKQAQKELGSLTVNDILLNAAQQTYIFVEGPTDEVCIEKFAKLLGYDLSGYNILICDGSAILLFSYFCIERKISFISIADNDNKFKPETYTKNHQQYKLYLQKMEEHPELCYFVGEGEKGCLEDLFDKESDKKFINAKGIYKGKINEDKIEKVKSLDEFSDKAVQNFTAIFDHFNIPKLNKSKK
ncbi:MAG: AAA family ATPase [Clostridia bacterium]|nr:AAA family ATPase [Clostridia bacterium]